MALEETCMKTITIVADDRVGLLADVSYILGKAKINIDAIGVDVVGGKALITLTIKKSDEAQRILTQNGYKVTDSNVIVVKLEDRPGELNKITSKLADEKINIQNVHMLSRDGKSTVLALVVDNPRRASRLLQSFMINPEEPV